MSLDDYNVTDNWIDCFWQIATNKYDGKEYFIKKFTSPKYPKKGLKNYEILKNEAETWFKEQNKIYEKVKSKCGPDGSLVIPVEFFLKGRTYYKITLKVDIEKRMKKEQIAKLPMKNRLMLLKTMSSALQILHAEKFIHNDLKPDNILITKGATGKYICKIIDFDSGFYEGKIPVDDDEDVHGSPEYYSPELVMYNLGKDGIPDRTYRDKITCKSDIFALGLIFHEDLTGKEILHDKNKESLGGKVLSKELTLDSSLTPYLSGLIKSMVQLDYKKRPTIDEVIDKLRNCDDDGNPKGPTPPEKYSIKNPNGSYTIFENGEKKTTIPENIFKEKKFEKEYPLKAVKDDKTDGDSGTKPPVKKNYSIKNPNGSYTIFENGEKKTTIPENIFKEKNYDKEYPVKE